MCKENILFLVVIWITAQDEKKLESWVQISVRLPTFTSANTLGQLLIEKEANCLNVSDLPHQHTLDQHGRVNGSFVPHESGEGLCSTKGPS